jgi:hypothetical protein
MQLFIFNVNAQGRLILSMQLSDNPISQVIWGVVPTDIGCEFLANIDRRVLGRGVNENLNAGLDTCLFRPDRETHRRELIVHYRLSMIFKSRFTLRNAH